MPKKNRWLLSAFMAILSISCNEKANSQSSSAEQPRLFSQGQFVSELGNNIMSLYQDKKNIYWFGSWETGLYRYDGKSILQYTTLHGLPSNRIEEIKEDIAGNIFINTSKGIVQFDGQYFRKLPLDTGSNKWLLEPQDLWFKSGWDAASAYRWDGDRLYKLNHPKLQAGEEYIHKNPSYPDPYAIYTLYRDSHNHMWFGTAALGVYRYDGHSFDWIAEKDVMEVYNRPDQGSNGVRSIIEDKDGYLWFNSAYRYRVNDRTAKTEQTPSEHFYLREKNVGSLDGKPDGKIIEYLSITKDRNQHLWIATYEDGIWFYNGKQIMHYPVQSGEKDIHVFSIYCDNKGNIWLGTHEHGAYTFNGQQFVPFKP